MEYKSRIVLVDKEAEVFGPEAMELIKLIDIQKSVGAAADAMKISTAKAWKYIRTIEKSLGEAAVVKTDTGKDKYKVHISPACRGLLEKYENFKKKSEAAIQKYYEQIF